MGSREALREWFQCLDQPSHKAAALAIINDSVFIELHLKLLEERREGGSGLYSFKALRNKYDEVANKGGRGVKGKIKPICNGANWRGVHSAGRELRRGVYSNESIDGGNSSDGSGTGSRSNSNMTSNDHNSSTSNNISDMSDEHSVETDESLSDIDDPHVAAESGHGPAGCSGKKAAPAVSAAAFFSASTPASPFSIGYVQSIVSSALVSVQGKFAQSAAEAAGASATSSASSPAFAQQQRDFLRIADDWHNSDDVVLSCSVGGIDEYDCLLCHQTFSKNAAYAGGQGDLLSVLDALSYRTIFLTSPTYSELQDMKRTRQIVPAMLRRWKGVLAARHKRADGCEAPDLSSLPYYLPLLLRLEFSLWESFYASRSHKVSRAFWNISLLETVSLAEEDLKALWTTLSEAQRRAVLGCSSAVAAQHEHLLEFDEPSQDVVELLVRCPIYKAIGMLAGDSLWGGADCSMETLMQECKSTGGSVFSALLMLQDLRQSLNFDTGLCLDTGHDSDNSAGSWHGDCDFDHDAKRGEAVRGQSPVQKGGSCNANGCSRDGGKREEASTASTVRRRTIVATKPPEVRSSSPRKPVTSPACPSSDQPAATPAPQQVMTALPACSAALTSTCPKAPVSYVMSDEELAALNELPNSASSSKKAKNAKKPKAAVKATVLGVPPASSACTAEAAVTGDKDADADWPVGQTPKTPTGNAAESDKKGVAECTNDTDSDDSSAAMPRRSSVAQVRPAVDSKDSKPAVSPKAGISGSRLFGNAISSVRAQRSFEDGDQQDAGFIVVQGSGKRRGGLGKKNPGVSLAAVPVLLSKQAGYSEAKGMTGRPSATKAQSPRDAYPTGQEPDSRDGRETRDLRKVRDGRDLLDGARDARMTAENGKSSGAQAPSSKTLSPTRDRVPTQAPVPGGGEAAPGQHGKKGEKIGTNGAAAAAVSPSSSEPIAGDASLMMDPSMPRSPPGYPNAITPTFMYSSHPAMLMPMPLPPGSYLPSRLPLDESLSRSILAYNQFVASCTRVHTCVLGELLREIQPLVEALWRGARVQVYGSMATGLAVPFSDIDLVIQRHGDAEGVGEGGRILGLEGEGAQTAPPKPQPTVLSPTSLHAHLPLPPYNHDPSSQEVIAGLWTLSGRLREMGWVQSVSPIPRAAIPIIKLDARVGVLMAAAGSALAPSARGDVFDISGIASDAALSVYARDPAVLAFAQTMDTIPIDITIEAGEHKVGLLCCLLLLIAYSILKIHVSCLMALLTSIYTNTP